MQRTPGRQSIWPIWLYACRCFLYNAALTLLGTAALVAFVLATTPSDQSLEEPAERVVRIASVLGPILLMTGGHALAVLAMRLFHGRELPYYLNARVGELGLALFSWSLPVAAGVILLAARVLWT